MKNIQLKTLHVKLIHNRKLVGNVSHVQFNLKLFVLVKSKGCYSLQTIQAIMSEVRFCLLNTYSDSPFFFPLSHFHSETEAELL